MRLLDKSLRQCCWFQEDYRTIIEAPMLPSRKVTRILEQILKEPCCHGGKLQVFSAEQKVATL